MRLCRFRSLLVVTFAAAIAAAGCGERALSSPTGPSALSDAATVAVDPSLDGLAPTGDDALAARNSGSDSRGNDRLDRDRRGRDRNSDDDDDERDNDIDDDGDGNRWGRHRNLSGFVRAVGADSITVRGVVVKVTPTTIIRHGNRLLTLAQIAVGDHVQVKGAMSADGMTFAAAEVKVEDMGRDNDDVDEDEEDEDEDEEDDVELKGAVAGLPATRTCPMLTFTIGTMTVKTNERTKFDGVTCATLANGQVVEVEGMKQNDGSLLATEVELEDGPSEVKGRISGLASTTACPNLAFTVGTTTIVTSNATVFDGVACAALANGRRVEVEGTLTGTTLAATKLELD